MRNKRAASTPARWRSGCAKNRVGATHIASDQRLPAHKTNSERKRFRIKAGRAAAASDVADGDDLVGTRAARGGDVDDVALGLADQRACDGRGDRQQAVLDIGLV